ncbi:efflux RND transporter periplasmic adaptor subunit [Brevibacillus daliensis]|uniref:efflux RND transporter periplasmic adaptor subunit n=1 Tax=Brevibacillus daliensis TaxID=2892995 RepID=UPI001E41C0A3|nr:efflux RND transporter periplasmic adaptor subunit [Brevibacillus daliensis]
MIKSKWSMSLVLVAALAVTGCTQQAATPPQENQEEKPVPVQIAAAANESVSSGAGYTGKLAPSQEVKVAPKAGGKITSLNAKLGQHVSKGSVLFTLDQDDLRNALKQAEAQYNVAVAGLNQSNTSTEQGIDQAKNGLAQAERALEDAKREAARSAQLFSEGAISAQQNEQVQTVLRNAEIGYNNAKLGLDSATKKSGVVVSEASVNQAKVALANAREQLSNATVTAPISGYVSQVGAQVGEMSSMQTPVVTLVNTNPLVVKANLAEDQITKIKVGQQTQIELPALDKKIDATITAVSPVMDQMLKAYPIEITVPNPNNELKSDMVVNLTILAQSNQEKTGVAIPRKALFDENGKSYVYKIEGDVAKKIEVVTGEESAELMEITSGVTAGDQIVIRGQTLLKDGSKVTIQKTD